MCRAQMTVLAVVVGIAIFLGVAVTLALLVFSVMSTRDIVRLDSQVRELTSVVSALSQSLQEASSSAELRLETLNQNLDEKTSSTETRLETLNQSLGNTVASTDQRFVSLNNSFMSSLHQLSHEVSSNHTQQYGDLTSFLENALPTSCQHYRDNGHGRSGVYSLNLRDGGRPFQVYCDMETDSSGWVVFQRRVDGSEDFYRTWADYKAGFGRLESEFWLGNDKLHRLTSAGLNLLRVDLEDWQNRTAYALYSSFSVAGEGDNYTLDVSGYDSNSTAGDSLSSNNGYRFSTRDNDIWPYTCAVSSSGAWWYYDSSYCTLANLNGLHNNTKTYGFTSNHWYTWGNVTSLKRTELKIRGN